MPSVQKVDLDFANLAQIDDGRINELLKFHLSRIAGDCIGRPADQTVRKVTLEFNIKPVVDPQSNEISCAYIEIECKSKVPVHRSVPFQMEVDRRGFKFNKDFPDQLDQPSLFPHGEGEPEDGDSN